jgi:hypothetical protein
MSLDVYCAKFIWRVFETDAADKTQLLGLVGKKRSRHVIAKPVALPGHLPRVGSDGQLGLEHPLVLVVAGEQHDPVGPKGHRPPITIGRRVLDRKNRHWASNLHGRAASIIGCIYRAKMISRPAGAVVAAGLGARNLADSTKLSMATLFRDA